MNAPLSKERLAEIRASVVAAPHPAPGTWALALRELLAEIDRRESERAETNLAVTDAAVERERLLKRIAELETGPATAYRASHESITFGHYTTAAAAREHCETYERRDQPTAVLDWIEDEEDGVAELVATVDGEETTTGYVVTALVVASEFDAEADE